MTEISSNAYIARVNQTKSDAEAAKEKTEYMEIILPCLKLEKACAPVRNADNPQGGQVWMQPMSVCPPPPDVELCKDLWRRYEVPAHIQDHCRGVAMVAASLAEALKESGAEICIKTTLAAGLLHDIGKAYSLKYGSSHCQIGAAWVMRETRNQQVAQAVYHHVRWMWEVDVWNDAWLPALLITYADKRVRHDQVVPLEERFADLTRRYGKTEESCRSINASLQQGKAIEAALSKRLGVSVDESSFNSRWLVS